LLFFLILLLAVFLFSLSFKVSQMMFVCINLSPFYRHQKYALEIRLTWVCSK